MPPIGPAPSRAGRRPVPQLTAAALVSLALIAPAWADEPTFYEKLAYGQIVLIGTCESDGRRAEVRVEEVIKGSLEQDRIRIAYRSANASRMPGDERLGFRPGERSILVVQKYRDGWGRERHEKRYVLSRGVHGKIDLPAEGSEALIEAARRLVEIQAERDQMRLWDSHRGLLKESNPHLVTAGFDEVLKFRLGNDSMIPGLLDYLTHPRDTFRVGSLRVLEQIISAHRLREEPLRDEGLVMRDILATARADDSEEVRSQAIRTLRLSVRPDVESILRQVAQNDPSQLVRYQAEVALLERSNGASESPSGAGTLPASRTSPAAASSVDSPGR